MDIGIPKETRLREHRVALAPSGVRTLVQKGHRVWVESDAGLAAGHPNADYQAAGAQIAYSRHEVFARAALVATVFAPDPQEYEHLQKDQIVFGFWGLPADAAGGLPGPGRERGHGGGPRGDRGRRGARPGADLDVGDRRQPGRRPGQRRCC